MDTHIIVSMASWHAGIFISSKMVHYNGGYFKATYFNAIYNGGYLMLPKDKG